MANDIGGSSHLGSACVFLFTIVSASRSRIMTKTFCRRWSWGILFGWMTFRRTYDTKHASPKPKCFRAVKVSPCSRFRFDYRQSLLSSRAPYLSYDFESIGSRCVANIMRWQASLIAAFRVGYCSLLRQILARCNLSRELGLI